MEFSTEGNTLAIDVQALERYLEGRLPGAQGSLSVRQFAGGQSNPTYHLSYPGGAAFVLRKKPPGTLLPTAHMVEREYRIFTALAGTDVPVPTAHLLCEDASVIGTTFFVMQYLSGRIFWDPRLPEVEAAERRAIFDEMARVLAALHSVDYVARGLSDFGKPGNYMARQVNRWTRQYEAAKTDDIDAMDRLIEWLPAHVPQDDQSCVVHGDYRLDNMVFHPSEPRVLGVLDWELSTLGHPLADLAYNCMPYHLASRHAPALSGFAGGDSGVPTEDEYIAEYCRRRGVDQITDWRFYLAFSMFRYASIVQGVYSRGLSGNASSAQEALQFRVRALAAAEAGWRVVTQAA